MKANIICILTAMLMVSVSCRTKDGEQGPAGESDLTRQGSITGTISYVDYNGKAVNPSFSYEYYETLLDNQFMYSGFNSSTMPKRTNIPIPSNMYSVTLSRRDLLDTEKRFAITLSGEVNADGTIHTPSYATLDLSFIGLVNNNVFLFEDEGEESDYVSAYPSSSAGESDATFDVSNLSLDILTGRLHFDYVATYPASNITYRSKYDGNTSATVTGTVDVVLNRKRQSTANPPILVD